MTSHLLQHAIVAGVAFVVVVVVTPLVRVVARVIGAVAVPGERHIHARPTPTLGGLAMLGGVFAAVGVATRLPAFDEVFRTTSEPEAIVLAALVIATVGAIDDTRGLSPPAKLAGQLLAAGMLVLFGVSLRWVYVPGDPGTIVNLGPDLAAIVTIIAVVAMMNAVNLVDGLDGLAAGVVAIAAAALFVYSQFGDPGRVAGIAVSSDSLFLAAVVGTCLGFLVYNWHPASVFMGDTGALLLGLLLAASGISAIGTTIQPTRTDFAVASVPVLVPALVLAVPFVDTILAIVRRLLGRRSIAAGDRQHLHHRLLAIGQSQPRAVLTLYYWSALLAFGVVAPSLLPARVVVNVLLSGILLGILMMLLGALRRHLRRSARRRAKGTGGDAEIVYAFTSRPRQSSKTASDLRKHEP